MIEVNKTTYLVGVTGLILGFSIAQIYGAKLDDTKSEAGVEEVCKNIILNEKNIDYEKKDIESSVPKIIEDELAQYGIDINTLNKESWDAFIKEKNIDYLNSLSDETLVNGSSLIHLAAKTSNLSFVKYLVDNGFDINQKNSKGLTPLSSALKNSDVSLYEIKKYMEMGAVLDKQSLNQALANPDKRKKRELIDFIKEQGHSMEGMELFRNANIKGNEEYLLELLPTIDANQNYREQTSAFEYSVMYNQGDKVIEYFLNNGVDLKNNNDGVNPLHYIRNKNLSIENYQRMIDLGANVNEQNKAGQTPLHYAVLAGDSEKVEFLLKNGALKHIIDKQNRDAYGYLERIHDEAKRESVREILNTYN